MATEEDIAAGLIDWLNSLSISSPVYTIDDLSDGSVIWLALRMAASLPFHSHNH